MTNIEQALCDVKEVALHTKLPGHKWEDNARTLAAEVKRLLAENSELQTIIDNLETGT